MCVLVGLYNNSFPSFIMLHRKDLSLSEKNEILKRYDALPKCSQRQAAFKLGIAQSSLSRIIQKRDSITAYISSNCNTDRKRRRRGKGSVFEDDLLKWYREVELKDKSVNRSVLIQKAEELAKDSGLKDFRVTDGWLTRWKQRNNISLKKEKQKEDVISVHNWTSENFPSLLENYTPDQIFNTDEVVLNFHGSLNCSIKSCSASNEENKVTVLLTCNRIGYKRIPLVVGKDKYLDCFEGIKTFPVHYKNSENALMTRDIFVTYLLEWDRNLGCKKIVLFLDCSFNHFEDLPLKNIKMIFLPSNKVSIIQPLDQGIIKAFKLLYRENIQMKVNGDINDGKGSEAEILQGLTILDVVHSIANAWLNVSPLCISDSFEKAGFCQNINRLENDVNRLKKSNSDIWPSICKSSTSEKKDITTHSREIDMTVASKEMDVAVLSGKTDVTVLLEETDVDIAVIKTDNEVNYSPSSNFKTEKYVEIEQNKSGEHIFQVNPPSAEEACNALAVIRKTLEHRGASVECYELFYKIENEVCKLLQKTT